MQEMWVWSQDQEDPLEEEMATKSSISSLRNPMDRGAGWATIHEVTKNCSQLKETNRMGKIRDLFKKIRDTKETFHAKMAQ